MASWKINFWCFTLLLNSFSVLAQYELETWEIKSREGDTILRVFEDDTYYDYFRGDVGEHEYVVDFSGAKFKAVLKTHKVSNNGLLKISFLDTVFLEFEVRDFAVNGNGKAFNYYSGELLRQGTFRSNKLHGILIFFDGCSKIHYVAEYRNGKFKGYAFHKDAINKNVLKALEKIGDPMEYKVIQM